MIEIDDAVVEPMPKQILCHTLVAHSLFVSVMDAGVEEFLHVDEAFEVEEVIFI